MAEQPPETSTDPQVVRTLLRLLAARPAWLLEHAQGYAGLALEQAALSSAAWQRRTTLQLLALASGLLSAGLAGVALMLWATHPQAASERLWLLVATPLLPLATGLALALAARGIEQPQGLQTLRQHWQADLDVLRGQPHP